LGDFERNKKGTNSKSKILAKHRGNQSAFFAFVADVDSF
jgi:hypothetical protein